MVKNYIISAAKANNLYWLGRYECRVYMTLHFMNKCCDKMIDGSPADYMDLWNKLDMTGMYDTPEAFTLGMLYDEKNPGSLVSAQRLAMDNAILLREDIMSETLSYIEMSLSLMKKCKAGGETNVSRLQQVIDWSLAFWGSAEQRTHNHRALMLMTLGRNVENMDMLLRFGYPQRRIALSLDTLKHTAVGMDDMIDDNMLAHVETLTAADNFDLDNDEFKHTLLKYVNQIVRV